MNQASITPHARERFVERFSAFDMSREMETAVQFGGQVGSASLWLSRCGAVFVLSEGVIVTTLTRDQAIANMQTFCGLYVNPEIQAKAPDSPPLAAIRDLAHAHAERDDISGCQPKTSKSERHQELRAKFNVDKDILAHYRDAYTKQRVVLSKQWKTLEATK